MERLCINCKHYKRQYHLGTGPHFAGRGYDHYCHALEGKQHPVLGGDVDGIKADIMRMALCGWGDPKLFEPKRDAAQ